MFRHDFWCSPICPLCFQKTKMNLFSAQPSEIIWAVNSGGSVFYRDGFAGTWTTTDGVLKHVTSGKLGVFGVNFGDEIYYRTGTMEDPTSAGTGWQLLPGLLKRVSAGKSTVWGVNSANNIFYMKNIRNHQGVLSLEWVHTDGILNRIASSPGKV